MQNSHKIPEPWRSHIASRFAEAHRKHIEADVIEAETIRIARTIAAEVDIALPPTFNLQRDGSKIIWETPDPPKEQTNEQAKD